MTDALAKKKRTRAGHKASATRTARQIEEIVASETPDKSKLALLRMTINEKLETIKKLDAEIVDLIDDETALVEEIEQADGYKETLFSALIQADKLLNVQEPTAPPTTLPTTPTATPPAKANVVRLPKLHLKHFNGDLTKWTSFWQSFEVAVDSNRDLSNVEKFNYLVSLLEGTAREAIAGLALTEANYLEAVSTHKKRFGGTQQIISKHMEALLQVEAVSNSQNVKALRRLFDHVSSHIRSLASLEVKEETYGNLLCPVLITKIPPDLQLIISRKVPEADWKLKNLLSTIEEEIVARERLAQSKTPRKNESRPPSTSATLVAQNGSQTCCYCTQLHRPTDCTTVTEVDARKQLLRKAGRCFSCLRKGHLSRNCRTSSRCQTCRGRHHTSICTGLPTQEETSNEATASSNVTESNTGLNPSAPEFTPVEPNSPTRTLYVNTSKTVLLQTASAMVFNPDDSSVSMQLRIVFDNGSQRSYMTQSARDTLRLKTSEQQRLAIAAFGSKRTEPRLCEIVRVNVQTRAGNYQSVDLFVVPHICDPLMKQPIGACLQFFSQISDLELADDPQRETYEIDMLIGSDFYWEFVTGETVRCEDGPVAVNTTLGWILSGPIDLTGNSESAVNLVTTHTLQVDDRVTNQMLDATLKTFWELESLGIQTEPPEDSVFDQFASSIKKKGTRYEVALPWRECHDPLPTNYDLSRRRLTGLLRRLRQHPEILKEYNSIIQHQLKEGIVEVVEEDETSSGMVHYLPHHAVVRQDKDTTKVRVVYDASSKSKGPSHCLHVGPKFNQRINELLFRFRSYPVALVADIEKAFLMISVNPDDRNVLRFLWVENPFDDEVKPVVLRFTRVVFGVSSSPFLLNATIKHHLETYRASKPELVDSLSRSTYVDDIVTGADSEDDAFSLYLESKEIFGHGSFNLRKFLSNSPQLQSRIDEREATLTTPVSDRPPNVQPSEESFSEVTLPTDSMTCPGEHKVLGVRWEVKNDQLVFDLRSLAERASVLQPTKRNVVSVIGQIYDPLGYLAPVTVTFKMLMQEVCKSKAAWDQSLTGESLAKWETLIAALKESRPFRIPRPYFFASTTDKVQLYGFCDASNNAYAAVVYVAESSKYPMVPSFVVAKTRVSPLKTQTIPRLELLSALLLARLIASVNDSLGTRYELLPPVCFTDSQVALCWIRGLDKDWKTFVQNRVEEIRRLVPVPCWRHCPGKDNPADIPSRGLNPLDLSLCKLWRNGPPWLGCELGDNPLISDGFMSDSCMVELKKSDPAHTFLTCQTSGVGVVIDSERFSTVHKLYRVTACVLKFIQLLRKPETSPEIVREDLTLVEEMWLRESQAKILQDKRFPTWSMQFSLFQDERMLWRCGGRIQNADLPYSAKHPILLNKDHHLTVLLIRDAHRRVQHNGVRETLTELRSKFWIIGGRSLVRSIIHSCVVCRRFEGRPVQAPPQPPLPVFRVTESLPFTYTAVDFAGPLYLRSKEVSDSVKVWICLFTCCASRAVHLELVFDMSTTTFIRCVKRFAARRGLPKRFLSDNAKTFKSAAKTLKTICEHPDTRKHLSLSGIEWSFNLEKAPWWGGLFERMVKSTKRCLRKVVGRARFSYDEMHTAIVEIEGIINSRPLSYVHPDDFEQPLTPSHLLVGHRLLSLPDHLSYLEPDDDEDFELTTESLHKRAKHLNGVLNHFWKRWSREYLLELRDTHRQRNIKKAKSSLATGDVVVVYDQDHPRGFWKLARVQSLITGRDGLVRGAVLRVGSKSGPSTVLQRPLQLLYPLEVRSDSPTTTAIESEPEVRVSQDEADTNVLPKEAEQQTRSRPVRKAAIKGREVVKQWCTAEDVIDHELVVNSGEDVVN